jgi:SAM-dependent methyltransferase
MQRKYYVRNAKHSIVKPGELVVDRVVGSWREHDEWSDYEDFMMKYVDPSSHLIALDFGCGPGRNIRRWSKHFARIDGADISKSNIANARKFLRGQLAVDQTPNLYVTTGVDCGDARSETYDFVFSTVCLQHICSHKVRFSILQDFYRILKPEGRVSIQMGYGVPSPMTVGYFENNFGAEATNRSCDTAIAGPEEPKSDFDKLGYVNFEYWIRPVGPGDIHPNWIFITATKPNG